MNDDQKRRRIEIAQSILKDDRHFSVVGCEDRAESGTDLAADLLDALGVDVEPCTPGCSECEEHRHNTGEFDCCAGCECGNHCAPGCPQSAMTCPKASDE